MKSLSEQLLELHDVYEEERTELFEMSNLSKRDTGLPRVIWVSVKTGGERHGPRIKVQKTEANKVTPNDWFSVTISDEPKIVNNSKKIKISSRDYKKIVKWIELNKKVLLDYWNCKTNTLDMIQTLQPLT